MLWVVDVLICGEGKEVIDFKGRICHSYVSNDICGRICPIPAFGEQNRRASSPGGFLFTLESLRVRILRRWRLHQSG